MTLQDVSSVNLLPIMPHVQPMIVGFAFGFGAGYYFRKNVVNVVTPLSKTNFKHPKLASQKLPSESSSAPASTSTSAPISTLASACPSTSASASPSTSASACPSTSASASSSDKQFEAQLLNSTDMPTTLDDRIPPHTWSWTWFK